MTSDAPTLEDVYADIELDPYWDYLRTPGINFVPGYGQQTGPRVLIVGEAPGATENARRRPFCGPSGRVLDQLLELADLRALDTRPEWADDGMGNAGNVILPANVFITNVVKYRPPGNRTPNAAEIAHGTKALRAEWAALGGPPAIIAVGSTAHTAVSPAIGGVMKHVGTWHNRGGTWITSVIHPAYALHKRDPNIQLTMEENWEQIGKFLTEEGVR